MDHGPVPVAGEHPKINTMTGEPLTGPSMLSLSVRFKTAVDLWTTTASTLWVSHQENTFHACTYRRLLEPCFKTGSEHSNIDSQTNKSFLHITQQLLYLLVHHLHGRTARHLSNRVPNQEADKQLRRLALSFKRLSLNNLKGYARLFHQRLTSLTAPITSPKEG